MTNINNGGRTPVAGLIHALVLLVIFLVLMPLAAYIPMLVWLVYWSLCRTT